MILLTKKFMVTLPLGFQKQQMELEKEMETLHGGDGSSPKLDTDPSSGL